MEKYNVHAGHCPQDQGAYGAVGILKESVENRIVKDEVIRLLKAQGHIVYDCTCNENTTQEGCLSKIVKKCKEHKVDLDISIHLNSGRSDYQGDGSIGGVEVWNYNSKTMEVSGRICSEIAKAIVEGILNKSLSNTTTSKPIETNKVPYLVKITAGTLNVRNGAGTKYKVNTQVKSGDVYTIVEEKNGWGKLKSGADWICLDYTNKI